jgi:predicted RNA binding protein YcfA (HicA-like mRNA interferase family)
MTRREKLVAQIRKRPSEADFDDVRRVLEAFGWTLDRERGSHCHFVKEGEFPITVPKTHGRTVKRVYLELIIERLGLDN